MIKMLQYICLITTMIFIFSGCSPFLQQTPEKHFYMFQPQRNNHLEQNKSDKTLRVPPFYISAAFEGQEIVIKTGPGRIMSDFQHRFFIPPAEMITEASRNWLAESPLFGHVLPNGGLVRPEYNLQGKITALYLDQTRQDQHRTILGIEFSLWKRNAGPNELIGQKHIQRETQLARPSAPEVIQAWNQDLESILQELERQIEIWLSAPPSQASG